MKPLLAFLLLSLVSCNRKQDDNVKTEALDTEVKSQTITSILGEGFGKVIEVEGRLVLPRRMAHRDKLIMEVHWVNDRQIAPPIVIITHGWGLTDEWVGKTGDWVRLGGFEGGRHKGAPKEAFPKGAYGGAEFYFDSEFNATARLEPKQTEQVAAPDS
ncbi:hypothetical protein HW115_18710 [Verrucomicrobiaceae bacterium N1E253]|uniref:Uncharacterized protein n=1 Tax=Oceaniferula marina TaxID=2748318 RepID=A0A851GJZ3_9BACT|nr:hypothetical protein [Oceaniferula marina]NWK57656.1 hypothetical protein [Oceaniferula marina]